MKSIVISFIFFILLFSYGCTDVLEKFPLETPSQETFFTNANEIEGGINACYSFLQETNDGNYVFPLVLDGMTNIAYIRENSASHNIGLGVHDDVNGTVVNTWRRLYQGIGRCNNMLKIIEENKSLLNESQESQFRGETLFLRGYYYSKLLLYFGDVPLILSPIEIVSEGKDVIRTNKDQVFDQIMDDFSKAAELLKPNYDKSTDIGRATKGAANAFKARTALYFGKYDIALTASKAVIESGIYKLYPKYGDLFVSTGLWDSNNQEIILKREYSALIDNYHTVPRVLQGRNPVGGYSSFVPTQQLVDSYHCIDGKNISESPLFDKTKPFENRDPRLGLTVVTPSSRFDAYQYEVHIDSTLCWNYETNTRVKNNNCYTASPIAVSHTGYLFRKYSDPSYVTKRAQGDYPIILCRYAEILLIFAEAKIELGQVDESVINALNSIRRDRDDVKMPEFTLDDFTDINMARRKVRHERKIELAMEGFRYHDLLRWGWANDYNNQPILGRPFLGAYPDWPNVIFNANDEPTYDYNNYVPHPSSDYRIVEHRSFKSNKHELWPIPQRDLLLNPNLTQNPGY